MVGALGVGALISWIRVGVFKCEVFFCSDSFIRNFYSFTTAPPSYMCFIFSIESPYLELRMIINGVLIWSPVDISGIGDAIFRAHLCHREVAVEVTGGAIDSNLLASILANLHFGEQGSFGLAGGFLTNTFPFS